MHVSDRLAVLAPVAAAVASAVGVLVALEQLTLRARVRRIAEWSSQLAGDETNAARKTALLRTRTWASGQLLASVLVPARHYLEGLAWGLGGPAMVALTPTGQGGLVLPSSPSVLRP